MIEIDLVNSIFFELKGKEKFISQVFFQNYSDEFVVVN